MFQIPFVSSDLIDVLIFRVIVVLFEARWLIWCYYSCYWLLLVLTKVTEEISLGWVTECHRQTWNVKKLSLPGTCCDRASSEYKKWKLLFDQGICCAGIPMDRRTLRDAGINRLRGIPGWTIILAGLLVVPGHSLPPIEWRQKSIRPMGTKRLPETGSTLWSDISCQFYPLISISLIREESIRINMEREYFPWPLLVTRAQNNSPCQAFLTSEVSLSF